MHTEESIQKHMPPGYKVAFREVRNVHMYYDIVSPEGTTIISDITLPFIPLWINGYENGKLDAENTT